jgi:hypothetical protein
LPDFQCTGELPGAPGLCRGGSGFSRIQPWFTRIFTDKLLRQPASIGSRPRACQGAQGRLRRPVSGAIEGGAEFSAAAQFKSRRSKSPYRHGTPFVRNSSRCRCAIRDRAN